MSLTRSEPFSLAFSRYNGTVSLAVAGDVNTLTAPQLRRLLTDVIDGQGNLSVVIDFSHVDFIDSAGLSVLIEASKLIKEKGGTLLLSRPRPSARRVFDMTGLDKVVSVSA